MERWRLVPNLITFNSCIVACGDWQQALAMLEALEDQCLAKDRTGRYPVGHAVGHVFVHCVEGPEKPVEAKPRSGGHRRSSFLVVPVG